MSYFTVIGDHRVEEDVKTFFSGNWSNNAEEHTSWAIAEEEPELPKGDSRIPKEMARVVEPSFSIIYFSQTSEIHFWIQMAEKGSKLNYKTYTLSACRQWEKGSKKVWQKKDKIWGYRTKVYGVPPPFTFPLNPFMLNSQKDLEQVRPFVKLLALGDLCTKGNIRAHFTRSLLNQYLSY